MHWQPLFRRLHRPAPRLAERRWTPVAGPLPQGRKVRHERVQRQYVQKLKIGLWADNTGYQANFYGRMVSPERVEDSGCDNRGNGGNGYSFTLIRRK